MPYNINHWKERIAGRTDLSAHVVHLTRGKDISGKRYSHLDILLKILTERKLEGSSTNSGFICGNRKAVCFQEAPLYFLSQNIFSEVRYRQQNSNAKLRYTGFGLMFPKPYIYRAGGRPVIYDRTNEAKKYLPESQWWRIVNFDLLNDDSIIDWTHEREWRMPNDFVFDISEATVLLPNYDGYRLFIKKCANEQNMNLITSIKGIVNLSAVYL